MIQKNILFILLLCSQFCCSQNFIFKEFGTNDGLPSLQVYDMYQGSNGIIWFATNRGLANYNGYEFRTFGVQDGVLDNVVLDFYPQKNGDIYCATLDSKLFYFKENFNEFIPYKYNNILEQHFEYGKHLTSLYLDDQENLHLSNDITIGKLVISKEGNVLDKPITFNTNKYKESRPAYLIIGKNNLYFAHYELNNIAVDSNFLKIETLLRKNALVTTLPNTNYIIDIHDKTVYVTDTKGKVVTKFDESKKPIALKVIDATHFFVGYHFGGGAILDVKGNIVETFLENRSITDFLVDNEGGYWFSTLYSGVFYSKEPKIKVFNTQINASINSLTKNSANELFIGYDNGDVERVDIHKKSFVEYASKNYEKAYVEFDPINKKLYVYSGAMFYKINEDNKRESVTDFVYDNYTIKLSEPTKEGVIISQDEKLTIVKNKTIKKLITPFRVHDACFWNTEIYLGTPLGVYVLKDEKIIPLETLNPLFENRVDDVDVNEKRNEIYFATLGAGIIIYDKKTEKIRTITKKDGLMSDIINQLYFENENELWVCTNSGLNKIKFFANESYEITGLKSSGGLLNDGISDVEVINDTVWIASRKGLIYAPKSLFDKKKEKKSYHLQIKETHVNDILVGLEKLKNLSYQENRVAFLVEGISFKESKELLYKHKLEGLDDRWYFTKHREILYPALPYGNYTLKIAATTSEKNEGLQFLEVPIHIKAPLWKQGWFVISAILATLLLIYLFFKYRILSYNRDIIRELLRLLIKKIKRKEKYFSFKDAGKEIRIKTNTILYVKSSGNYIEIVTDKKNYTVRNKIGEFIQLTPDPLEYIRIHRSYIIRIDKVVEKNSKEVIINGKKLPVSNSYAAELNNLIF